MTLFQRIANPKHIRNITKFMSTNSKSKKSESVVENITIGLGIPFVFLGTAALGCKLTQP